MRIIISESKINKYIQENFDKIFDKLNVVNESNLYGHRWFDEDGHTYCNNNLGDAYCLFHYPECQKCRISDSLMMVSIVKNK